MPRRKFIDKKSAQTFTLVHRPQNDPLIHDEDAPSMVFAEKATAQLRRPRDDDYAFSSAGSVASGDSAYRSSKTRQRGDLEDEFGLSFRANEGQAAQHGVFFDDTEYDYMQHMRDLGTGDGAVTWVEASAAQPKKGKQKLEEALKGLDMDEHRRRQSDDMQSIGSQSSAARSLLPEDVLPSEFVRKRTYQDQQDVPDDIAGFQPDMDPRLREVLEALEDEEYVDDQDDDDVFNQLTRDGYEVEQDEWERLGEQQMFEEGGDLDEEEGWESDDTVRAASPQPRSMQVLSDDKGTVVPPPDDALAQPPADPSGGAWLDEFKKFKSGVKAGQGASEQLAKPTAPSALESSALSSIASGRRKKRKGAQTSTTNYSMTSSALARTDQQTLMDSRFDKIEEDYAAEELADDDQFDDANSILSGATGLSNASKISKYSTMSGMSGASGTSSYSRASDAEAPQLVRSDFDGIMDDFLGGYTKSGKLGRRVKRGGPQTGMEQLDEIRKGLGPARVKSAARAS